MLYYSCLEGHIPGAEMMGKVWLIPKDAKNLPMRIEKAMYPFSFSLE